MQKALLLALLMGATAVAGCLATDQPPPAPAGWSLDCTLGSHERGLAGGGGWAQDCITRASHTAGAKQEVWLAVNPLDADNVIVGAKDLDSAISRNCVWNGIFVTHDGGASWKNVYISGKYADRRSDSPYYGYACNTDPMGVFTADGTAHWVIEMYNLFGDNGYGPLGTDPSSGRGILQPGWKLVLAHSHDGGDTWPLGEVTTLEYGDGAAALNDYSRIALNPETGTVHTMINTWFPGIGTNTSPLPVQPPVYPGGELCSILGYKAGGTVQAVGLQPRVQTGMANPGNLNCLGIAANANGTLVLGAIGNPTPAAGTPAAPNATFSTWFATSTERGARRCG
ncbi:MAG: hypothetical protein LC620_02130 [Halobacteriales archaeon]|nr:hypothetical protein [Halobacteriales archaeon]